MRHGVVLVLEGRMLGRNEMTSLKWGKSLVWSEVSRGWFLTMLSSAVWSGRVSLGGKYIPRCFLKVLWSVWESVSINSCMFSLSLCAEWV